MKNNRLLKSQYYDEKLQPSIYTYKTNVTMMIPRSTGLSLISLIEDLPVPRSPNSDKIDELGEKIFGLLNTDPDFLQKVLDFKL